MSLNFDPCVSVVYWCNGKRTSDYRPIFFVDVSCAPTFIIYNIGPFLLLFFWYKKIRSYARHHSLIKIRVTKSNNVISSVTAQSLLKKPGPCGPNDAQIKNRKMYRPRCGFFYFCDVKSDRVWLNSPIKIRWSLDVFSDPYPTKIGAYAHVCAGHRPKPQSISIGFHHRLVTLKCWLSIQQNIAKYCHKISMSI